MSKATPPNAVLSSAARLPSVLDEYIHALDRLAAAAKKEPEMSPCKAAALQLERLSAETSAACRGHRSEAEAGLCTTLRTLASALESLWAVRDARYQNSWEQARDEDWLWE